MELRRSHSREIIERTVPPLAVWVVARLLNMRRVASAVDRVDRRIEARRRSAARSFRRARRNAAGSPILLTAGMVAVVAGLALIAKSAAPQK